METAIKSEEIFRSAEIRSLSDAEIDCVEGGVYAGASYVLRLAEIFSRILT